MRLLATVVLGAMFVTAAPSWAAAQGTAAQGAAPRDAAPPGDEVTLNDGSVLKGTIVFIESDTITFESAFYEPITISVWDVRSVTTAAAVDVVVDSGEVWRGKIAPDAGGEMMFTPADGGDPRPLNFGFVSGVYQLYSVWDHKLTFGLSRTTGNADVLGVSLLGSGQRDSEEHRFTWNAQVAYAEANGETVEQNWTGVAKYDYFVRPRLYLAFAEELRHDEFKDLRVRSVTSASLGYVFLTKPETILEAEIGGGALAQRFYRAEDFTEEALRASAYYKMPIGSSITVEDRLVTYVSDGTDRLQVTNVFTFELSFARRWGLEVVNMFNHDSEESSFAEASDSQWTVGLSYTF